MKEQNWDDTIDAPAKFLDAANLLFEEVEAEPKKSSNSQKSEVTDLRRRIEERLEAKRISHEFDYEEFESWPDNIQ